MNRPSSHNAALMADATAYPPRRWGAERRRLLIAAAAVLGVGLVAAHSNTCYALAADAYQSVTDSYLIMWIERAGSALGCF